MLVLLAGSGCSALIYEIVWYQLLQLALGSTALSLGVLLATFMGGLCLGSGASRPQRRPYRQMGAGHFRDGLIGGIPVGLAADPSAIFADPDPAAGC